MFEIFDNWYLGERWEMPCIIFLLSAVLHSVLEVFIYICENKTER